MVVFGALLALGNPERKGMMIAFVFLCQVHNSIDPSIVRDRYVR